MPLLTAVLVVALVYYAVVECMAVPVQRMLLPRDGPLADRRGPELWSHAAMICNEVNGDVFFLYLDTVRMLPIVWAYDQQLAPMVCLVRAAMCATERESVCVCVCK